MCNDFPICYLFANRFPDYKFLSSLKHIADADTKVRFTDEGVTGIAEDVALLAECDFTVGTLSSNVRNILFFIPSNFHILSQYPRHSCKLFR